MANTDSEDLQRARNRAHSRASYSGDASTIVLWTLSPEWTEPQDHGTARGDGFLTDRSIMRSDVISGEFVAATWHGGKANGASW